jgi:hypothetical protein
MSRRRKGDDGDRFRVRPGPSKARQPDQLPRFITRVLREASKAGGRAISNSVARPGTGLGRGHVATRFTCRSTQPGSRRLIIKIRRVNLKQAGPQSTP